MKVNERLKNLREDIEPKMNQTELGQVLGMTQRRVSFLETGTTEPNLDDIRAYCRYFDISADYILGLTDDPKPLK
ncbi:MAG: helix-turn-helix transcriptional regulator [Clostridia bacterium]|nr:helix-turn-helix transcriptional regulator [Clostridia bacterium]